MRVIFDMVELGRQPWCCEMLDRVPRLRGACLVNGYLMKGQNHV